MASTRAILAATKAAPAGRPTPAPQGAAPYFGAVSPLVANLDAANGYTYSQAYGSFLPRPPHTFTQGAFGPFSPILPVPVDTPEESGRARPRRVQYQTGFDLPVGEPGLEGLKLAAFSTLRTLADLYSVARACIQLRKSEVRGLAWDIMPTPDAAKANKGNEKWFKDFGQRRAHALKFLQRPDPDYFSWNSFIDAFLEEVFVFDALSLYLRPKRGKGMRKGLLGSDLDSIELLSGPTIRPLYGIHGQYPRPPAPAYQQYLYGVPRSDFMQMITGRDIEEAGLTGQDVGSFRGDQLLYLPLVPRRWTPYGFCFDDRTEVLTSDGWKHFANLNGTENVATRATDGTFEWQRPHAYIAKPHDGTMLHFRSQVFDLMVTPEHRMLVQRRPRPDRSVSELPEFKDARWFIESPGRGKNWRIPLTSRWKGTAPEYVTIPAAVPALGRHHRAQELHIAASTWARFLGWFVSEGCVVSAPHMRNYINIAQIRDLHRPHIRATLGAMGMPYRENAKGFDINHGPLAEILREICYDDSGEHKSWNKRIPAEVKNYPPELLEELFDAMMRGDGHTEKLTGLRRYVTTSKGLADDTIEILQKMGSQGWYDTPRVQRSHYRQQYRITERPGDGSAVPTPCEVAYDGMTYCVSVPNETVYVRRNGRTAWCGNSPIERALIPVMSGLQKQNYALDFFREGTVPAVYMSPGDESMTPNQIRELQDALNAFAGDPAMHHKIIVLPPGTKVMPQRDAQLADQFDEIIMTQVCMGFDIMPMELGIAPKVSTTMSPGASNQMAKMAQAKSERKSTKPLLVFISDIMNAILMDVCHQDDMRFVFEGLEEEEDQEQLTGLIVQQVSNGLRSIDEGRDLLGLQPWGLPETSGPIFTSPTTGPVPLVAAMQAATANAETATTNAANAAAAGRQPAALPPGQQSAEQPAPAGAAAGEPGDAGTRALSTAEEANDTPGHAASESVDDTAGRQGARGSAGSAGGAAGGKQSSTSRNTADSQQNSRSSGGSGKSDKMTVTVGLDRAVNAELEALARHLRKGRLISTWVPKNLPPRTLAVISENLAKGLEPDQAVAFAKATTLAGEAVPKAAATPSASWPAWDHSAALAARYEPRILAAFHSAAPHIRSLLEQYQSGALAVTDTVLEGMISDVIAAALKPVLGSLWRQAWIIGDRAASSLVAGLATKDDYSFDGGDDGFDEGDLGDLSDEFDQVTGFSGTSVLREIATTGVAALVTALATQGVDGVMPTLDDRLHLSSRVAMIAGNEVARLLNLGADARYGASGVTMVEWLAGPASCARLCIPNADQGPIPRGNLFQSGVAMPPAHVACSCALGAVDVGAQKFLRRTIPLNGQETWTEADPAAPNAAGGGGQSPVRHWGDGTQAPDGTPVTGGVPGSTAGGEPPRWDTPVANGYQGGLNDLSDRTNPAQGHDGGHDSDVPFDDRPVAVDARGAGYPTTSVDRWPSGGHGTGQPSGSQVPGDANDRGAWGVRKASGPVAAGIAVYAADTGRVLMLQRALSDDDPAAGLFEFPGGCCEDDDEPPNVAAKREWEEETGTRLPEGEFTGQWEAGNGKYHGYVYTVAHEDDVPIHDGRDEVDDPDGDHRESLAWFDPQHLVDNPAVRPELAADLDLVFDALGVTVDKSVSSGPTAAPAQVKALMLRNFPASALDWVDKAQWTGPTDVPLDRIDFTNRGSWAAHHETDRVQHFADKIRTGDAPHPAILVDTPGEHDYMVVDGHHRALAYRSLGKPVPSYVGRVNAKVGPWDECHLYQQHQGADSGNE